MRLPSVVKRIGESEDESRVYIEDYVYSYLNELKNLQKEDVFMSLYEKIVKGEEKISLSKNEYRILLILMENKGKVVSREKLMEQLWKTDSFVDENTLSVNVNRLRKRLDVAGLENFITTKFGIGYLIEN